MQSISLSSGRWIVAASLLLAASGAANAANKAPTISGKPATSVNAESKFWFRPTAKDANGDKLKFSIVNKPAWMTTFRPENGAVMGTPSAKHAGIYRNIIIRVSDGKSTTSLPPFSVKVVAGDSANTAPRISGVPLREVSVAERYSFTPKATDANGDTLAFTIKNKPTWASFNTVTGKLQGTPTSAHVGSFAGISISVSDGKKTVTLPSFAIAVAGAQMPSSGTAALSWTPPQENTDGSTLTNLAGYSIHYGTEESVLTQSVKVTNPSITNYVVEGLNPGSYYFSVKAYNSKGAESAFSEVVSKQIR